MLKQMEAVENLPSHGLGVHYQDLPRLHQHALASHVPSPWRSLDLGDVVGFLDRLGNRLCLRQTNGMMELRKANQALPWDFGGLEDTKRTGEPHESHNQNLALKWTAQNHVKKYSKEGGTVLWLGLSLTFVARVLRTWLMSRNQWSKGASHTNSPSLRAARPRQPHERRTGHFICVALTQRYLGVWPSL